MIIVIVADEVLDRILRKERLEFLIELGRQGLVVGDDQHRHVVVGYQVRHREGLATAGDAHQRLERRPLLDAGGQLVDGLRLIARRLIRTIQFVYAHAEHLPRIQIR